VISRSRRHLVVALLLPLLALKALLPPGYMPAAGEGRLRIVMCSAGLAALAGEQHDGTGSQPAEHATCAFAMAGAAAPPPSQVISWLPLREAGLPLAPIAAVAVAGTGLRRFQSPRGPPAILHDA
jgi:hypothetical protein